MDARCEPGGRERERRPLRGSQGRLKLVDEWEGHLRSAISYTVLQETVV